MAIPPTPTIGVEHLFGELLQKIHFLATSRSMLGLAMGARRKAFICFGGEPVDSVAQCWARRVEKDLQCTGLDCVLSGTSTVGNCDALLEGIEACDVALVVCTPQFASQISQTATNTAFEMAAILQRAERGKMKVIPILLQGDPASLPSTLTKYVALDFRAEQREYHALMTRLADPPGLVPAIWDFRVGDASYESLLREYEHKKAVALNAGPAGSSCDVPAPGAPTREAASTDGGAPVPGSGPVASAGSASAAPSAPVAPAGGAVAGGEVTLRSPSMGGGFALLPIPAAGPLSPQPPSSVKLLTMDALTPRPSNPATMSMPTRIGISSVVGPGYSTQPLHSVAAAPSVNPFVRIHEYLMEKLTKDKGRVKDFSALLVVLRATCTVAAVQEYLNTHPDFHHHSSFKGNRYHELRNKLLHVGSNALLSKLYDEYRAFLVSPGRDERDAQLKAKLIF